MEREIKDNTIEIKVKISVDDSQLDSAITKAKELSKLLTKTAHICDRLSDD